VLKAWEGKPENVQQAQTQLLVLAKNNSLATAGAWTGQVEDDDGSLHVRN